MNAARLERHAVLFGEENDLGVGGRRWGGLGQTDDGVGSRWFLPRGQVRRKDPYSTRCDTDGVHVTAVFTMITVQFPVRKLSVVGIQRMAELLLMGSRISVWSTVDDYVSGALDTHEEQGYKHELADKGAHVIRLLRIAQERSG